MARFFRNQEKLAELQMMKSVAEAASGADALVLAVGHREYLDLNPDQIVEMVGRPLAIVDCFGILNDDNIRRYFELGCEVKGLGRGHVKRIKDEVKESS
jgi:UDP-N-acetyl-D-mannosaminuronate dehydrogenase